MEEKFYTDIAVFDSQQKFDELTKQSSVKYHFKNCRFFNITFSDDTLTGNLENCHFNRCTFENFNGQKLNLNGSEFAECKILNSNFENAYFEGTDIYRSEINNSYFKLANFSTASIRNTIFKGNNLSSALFYGAVLDDVTMKDTVTEQAAQGLTLDDITIDGAAHQEIETNRLQILKQLKIEPVSAQQIYENAKANLEPLPAPKIKNKQIKFKIEPANPVTEYLYNVQVHFKYDFADEFIYPGIGRFCKNIDEVDEYINKIETEYSKDGYMFSYEGREELVQQQHLDKLKIIAEYEQHLNVSPEERIVEMNYSTAHWQSKDNITPDQAEAVYNHITDKQHIGFDSSNKIRQSVGKPLLTPDEYYHNIKNMAFVTRYNFGNENSIDIEAIQSALKEVPIEYVISQMTDEQFELYADYYETAVDYSGGLELGLSQHDTELYNHIISFRNNTSISNKVLENKIEPEKITLDDYLAQRGLASPVDDFMIDKLKLPHGQSKYDERKMHENARKSSQEYHERRNAAIQEYREKVASGEIVEPTNLERYMKTASGNPEKSSVQAAKRVLAKRGYVQNSEGEWILKEKDSNAQQTIESKSLTKEEFDKLTSEIKEIAKTYQSDPDLLADYFAFKAQFYQYSPTNAMNVFSSALAKLIEFIDAELEQMICGHSPEINAADFIEKPTALFLICPDEDTSRHFFASLFIRYFTTQLIDLAEASPNMTLQRKVLCLWDEFGNMPPIKDVDSLFTAARSRGIRFLYSLQSFSQLKKSYNKTYEEIILDSSQILMFTFVAPTAYETAKKLSDILGSQTVLSGTVSHRKETFTIWNRDNTATYQMIKRPLMFPDEIMSIPLGTFIVIKTGSKNNQIRMKTHLPLYSDYCEVYPDYSQNIKFEFVPISVLNSEKIRMLAAMQKNKLTLGMFD